MTDTSIIEERGSAVVEMAKGIEITDNETYQEAVDFVRERIKPLRKEIDATFDPLISDANKAHKNLIAEKKRHEQPLVDAEGMAKTAISSYKREQERKREEAERKRREEERRRQQEEEENRRVEQARKDEEAKKLREAEEAEAAGNEEEAEKILDQVPLAPETPPIPPPTSPSTYVPPVPKADGVSVRKRWSAKVVDIKALCAAVAKAEAPTSFVEGNMTILNAVARGDKERFSVPGVEAVSKDDTAIR